MFLRDSVENPTPVIAYSTVLIYSYLMRCLTNIEVNIMTAFTQTGTMINPALLRSAGQRKAASLKGDIALVAFWAALVPGLMWFGAMVGF
jgi:hypothetical protein